MSCCLEVCMRSGSACLSAGERCIGLSASDREFPALTGRSGTQRARRLLSRTTPGSSAPWCSSPSSDLRITRVFPCVARPFRPLASFRFTGSCWWPLLVVVGGSGAPRGHGHRSIDPLLTVRISSQTRAWFIGPQRLGNGPGQRGWF